MHDSVAIVSATAAGAAEPTARAADSRAPALPRPLRAALWMIAGAIVAGWLALAALNLDDDYRGSNAQGVWMAAAEAARAGTLYPPLYDGQHYAGTRYMPVPILLNALASAAAGDPLVGGRLLAGGLMAALLVLATTVLRHVSCPWHIAAPLAAAIVGTEVGLQAATTVGGDLVAAVLQLGALTLVLRSRQHRSIAAAGMLAGMAIASKLTGLWALLAVVSWLGARRQWRAAGLFGAASVITAAVILGIVQRLTGGGLSDHLLTFSTAGVQGVTSLLRAPNQLLYQLIGHAYGAVVLLPLAAVGALLSGGWRHQSVIHLALGYALLLLLAVYTDVGTGFNQLLDVVVLGALAVGVLAGRAAASDATRTGHVILLTVAMTVLWAAGLDLVRTIGRDLRLSVSAATRGPAVRAAEAVAGMVRPGETLLAQDPAIYVALGRQPLIMDAFMLARLDRAHPEWVHPLIASIAQRRFGLVVLTVPLENRDFDLWWSDFDFGPRVAGALRQAYRWDRQVGRYHLYRPVRRTVRRQ